MYFPSKIFFDIFYNIYISKFVIVTLRRYNQGQIGKKF